MQDFVCQIIYLMKLISVCMLFVYNVHSYHYYYCLLLQITYADLQELPIESNRNAADQEAAVTYSQIA